MVIGLQQPESINTSPPSGTPIHVQTVTASGIVIHGLVCGLVSVKEAHRTLAGPSPARFAMIAVDWRWTEWLPIWVWVLEHPEGIIVIDTGETARVVEPGHFDCDPMTGSIYRRLLRFSVPAENEIGPRMERLGISPLRVRWVVQTHLHSDHAGGLGYFPGAQILVSRHDAGGTAGSLPCRWPQWFRPSVVDQPLPARSIEPGPDLSGHGVPLTRAGDVWLIPTPRHTIGHQSVVLQDGDRAVIFAGDASFSEEQLVHGTVAGICADTGAAVETLWWLREFARTRSTVYLPTHDAASGQRLGDLQPTRPFPDRS